MPTENKILFPAEDFYKLQKLIEALPLEYRLPLEEAFDNVTLHVERRRRILEFIQEALSQLRLDMKYLMFDLDATRHERDEYKKQLENIH